MVMLDLDPLALKKHIFLGLHNHCMRLTFRPELTQDPTELFSCSYFLVKVNLQDNVLVHFQVYRFGGEQSLVVVPISTWW